MAVPSRHPPEDWGRKLGLGVGLLVFAAITISVGGKDHHSGLTILSLFLVSVRLELGGSVTGSVKIDMVGGLLSSKNGSITTTVFSTTLSVTSSVSSWT
jgi:hypothetical protein